MAQILVATDGREFTIFKGAFTAEDVDALLESGFFDGATEYVLESWDVGPDGRFILLTKGIGDAKVVPWSDEVWAMTHGDVRLDGWVQVATGGEEDVQEVDLSTWLAEMGERA